MSNASLSFEHTGDFIQSGITHLISVDFVSAIMGAAEEDLLEIDADNNVCVFSSDDDAQAFYKAHTSDIQAINELRAWNDLGVTGATRIHKQFESVGVDTLEDAQLVLSGEFDEDISNLVYIGLTNDAAAHVWQRYESYGASINADNSIEAFFEWRDDNQQDGLISWYLGERAIQVIGGNEVFIDACKRERGYSVATDGVAHYFASFNSEDFGAVRFLQDPEFKYYKPSLIQTIRSGMVESEFDGFIPTYDQIDTYFERRINEGFTDLTGCAVTMWLIEQLISQLRADYNNYLMTTAF